jgi:hypothetical protein
MGVFFARSGAGSVTANFFKMAALKFNALACKYRVCCIKHFHPRELPLWSDWDLNTTQN